ncbi:MAG: hypothetical protein U1E52_02955 [Geminicoccaceae bacterium]
MSEPVAAAAKKRGPKTPEGKARSKMNALRHGLRAREFGLLPEEDPAEWAVHLAEVHAGLGPREPYEEQLSTAVAVAMWLEIRADRVECDVMAEIAPLPERHHGGDLKDPANATSLGTAIRYRTGAGMAVQRAQRAFYAYRKARQDGLVVAQPPEAAAIAAPANTNEPAPGLQEEAAPFAPAGEFRTNDLPPGTDEPDEPVALGRRAAVTAPSAMDDAAWLATVPVVESDPAREARRRELLLQVEPVELRRGVGHATLANLENHLIGDDMAAYEEWFARQPKPPRVPAKSLTEEDAALVRHVTRHNPPWLKGEYLSYWRPPVPKELLGQPGTPLECMQAKPATPAAATIATPLAELRARVARLLDRGARRRPDEIELAEAVCAVKWPHWGPYAGPVDLELLRRALDGHKLDGRTLAWLDSHEFADECREEG